MRRLLRALAVALPCAAPLAGADTTLLVNVNGYTLNAERELVRFAALRFTDDRIDALYRAGEEPPAGADAVIDGGGRTVLPGLIDAHGHVLSYGLSLLRVDLTGAASERDAVERVAAFMAANEGLAWIQGRGWNQTLWDEDRFPAAASLDAAAPDAPVWLTRVDGHAGWANSAAMALAGITRATPDPDGGQIVRGADGEPTGVLVDNAMALVSRRIPPLSDGEIERALLASMRALAALGLTGVHDAGIDSATVRAYRALAAAGPLPIRVNAMIAARDPDYSSLLARGPWESADGTLALRSVKVVADGALGSRGAALEEDYSDMPGHRGLLLLAPERLEYFMRAGMNAGFQVNTHAIGDAANRIVLDHYERLIAETGTRGLRHRIEHAQVLRLDDVERFAALGVVPSMQATHATSDKNMAGDRLGPARLRGAYAWRRLLDAGARIANGSDFPVEPPDPFFGLHAAATRQDRGDEPPGGWLPGQAMTLAEALASFTLDAAWAGLQEDDLGSLEPGKKADFIMVDRDVFAVPAGEIWRTRALETWVNGAKVAP